ncbi:unnamed protein product [Sphagnum balticum]
MFSDDYNAFSALNEKEVIVRLLPSGKIDTSYGVAGFFNTPRPSDFNEDQQYVASLFSPDGSILLANQIYTQENNALYPKALDILRISSQGTLDSSFGLSGRLRILTSSTFDAAAIVPSKSGTVIAAGGKDQISFYRILGNGQLDSSFGTLGVKTVAFSTVNSLFQDLGRIVVDREGYFWATGRTVKNPREFHGALLRFTPEGEIDSAFGKNGILEKQSNMDISNILPLSQGGVLLVITTPGVLESGDYALLQKLTEDGNVNLGFGFLGTLKLAFYALASMNNIIELRNQDFLMSFINIDPAGSIGFLKSRRSGEVDRNFGSNGEVTETVWTEYPRSGGFAIQSSGAIIRAVTSAAGSGLHRYNP